MCQALTDLKFGTKYKVVLHVYVSRCVRHDDGAKELWVKNYVRHVYVSRCVRHLTDRDLVYGKDKVRHVYVSRCVRHKILKTTTIPFSMCGIFTLVDVSGTRVFARKSLCINNVRYIYVSRCVRHL